MSHFLDFNFSTLQIIVFSLLLCLLIIVLLYLYVIYYRVVSYRHKADAGKVGYTTDMPSVSVVVYAHAEEAGRVLDLLPKLLVQKYPEYEVIVVNDGTSEEIQNAVSMYECEHSNVYQTFVPDRVSNVSRKKLGITLGIKASKYDVIVLTDANCVPVSDNWLQSIARNFVPGVDVVLGYTRMANDTVGRKCRFKVFDRMTFALRFLSFAVLHRPYMGMGSNLAYRKEAFFALNGFSSTLNLHFGDDDLLVNEIAHKSNTRIEISPESIVESINEDNCAAWDELRMRYNFTSKYLRTSSKAIFRFETFVHILFWITFAASLAVGYTHLLCVIAALLMMLLYWLFIWRVYLTMSRLLGESCRSGLVPFYYLLRPCYQFYYSMVGKSYNKSNFTWQYLR